MSRDCILPRHSSRLWKCELRRYVRLLLRLLDLQDSYKLWGQYCAFRWKISFEKSHALAFGLPILPLKLRLLAPSTVFSIVLISLNDPKNILTDSNFTWFQKTCPLRRTFSQYCRYAVREGVRTNPMHGPHPAGKAKAPASSITCQSPAFAL